MQELDWLVCSSGADIWHATAAGDAGGVAWSADERWEAHIDFRRALRPSGSGVWLAKLCGGFCPVSIRE